MRKVLYVSDLDGTLLTDDCALSDYTVRTLNAFVAQGGLFTFATARSPISAGPLTAALDLRLPVIVFNGTFILDLKSGAQHAAYTLSHEVAATALSRMEAIGMLPLVFSIMEGRERVSWVVGRETAGIRRYIAEKSSVQDARLRPVTSVAQLLEGEVFYLTLIDHEEAIRAAQEALCGLPGITTHKLRDTYTPSEYWLETASEHSGKDKALRRLRDMLAVDRVVCFGDNLNDIPLFAAADEGYAVANAQPALKALATGIIAANSEDGVARYLAALLEAEG